MVKLLRNLPADVISVQLGVGFYLLDIKTRIKNWVLDSSNNLKSLNNNIIFDRKGWKLNILLASNSVFLNSQVHFS